MVVTFAIVILVMGAFGYMQVRTQSRLRGQIARLPADARTRMKTAFPAIMGLIIVVTFIAIYLLRPHS
jgi:UDP-N-acetylmuramyl pentapeptide phosphotransferase/UDP-N-acetylglucosamine-1-phosphate transferase